jgi:hypothetical protein
MMKQKKTSGTQVQTAQSSAAVVDGKLILTFPDAITPVVWQMNLDQAQSAALEVQEDKKRKVFAFVLKDTKGESVEIAPFEEKSQAVHALMMASQALQNAHGKIRPQAIQQMQPMQMHMAQAAAPAKSGKTGSVIAICLILVLLAVWVMSTPRKGSEMFQTEGAGASSASSAQSGQAPAGVPVSGDEFLSSQ